MHFLVVPCRHRSKDVCGYKICYMSDAHALAARRTHGHGTRAAQTMAHIHLLSLIFYPPYDVGAMVTSLVAGAPLWPTCGIPPPPHCWGLPCRPDGCAPHTGAPAALGPPHGPPRDKKTAAAPRGHVGVTLGDTLRARRRHPGGYKGPQQHLEGILGVKRTTAAT